MQRRLVIDALAFEQGKSYGYQEYLFNLLEYIYIYRTNILYESIIIICLESQKDYFVRYEARIKIKSYSSHSIYKRLFIQTYMPFDLKLTKKDLVLYTSNYSSLIKRASSILVIHDLLFKRKKLFPYTLMRWQRQFYLPISINKADKIIAISKFTANDINEYYKGNSNKVEVIYNYFNFKKYPTLDKISKENYFISVCSSAYHKNTITILKAFDKYCLNGGSYNLILVGALKKGTDSYLYYEQMSEAVKSRLMIYDKIDNHLLAELYEKSKAYISASLFEGLGMPIIEAMYFNLPVILSDYPVFHEVSMEKGFYFNPLSEKELVKRMLYIQNNLTCFCDYKGIIIDRYSERNTSQKYIDLINEMYNKTN